MNLLIATRNRHKLREIQEIFAAPDLRLLTVEDFPHLPDVVEEGDSFEANAEKKAVEIARAAGTWTLADDSGLEVEALGGLPGVRSARFAGEPVNCEANSRKLLEALGSSANRRARFRCVIALASPDGVCRTVEGRCGGSITRAPRGANGFGYDPLFVPEGHTQTFAEMDPALKNRISHRSRALSRARAEWCAVLGCNTVTPSGEREAQRDGPREGQAASR
jgi:XTP/dITP diphosphohydrolase